MKGRSTPALAWTLALSLHVTACGARSGLSEAPRESPLDAALMDLPGDLGIDLPRDIPRDTPSDRTTTEIQDTEVGNPPRAVCGNGLREPGEACDLGAMNRFIPAFALAQRGVEAPVSPVVRRVDIVRFYDYRSASAHTGFELPGVTVTMLFVDASTNDLGLLLFTGHDDVPGVSVQPSANWDAVLTGVPSSSRLAVSDDPGEFTRTSTTEYRGHWSFQQNTDGGAISALPWSTPWRISVTSTPLEGISSWRYSQQDRGVNLVSAAPATLIHYTQASPCRPDCILPSCGDGFVDGNERCDDGNTLGGDGCTPDCQLFQ